MGSSYVICTLEKLWKTIAYFHLDGPQIEPSGLSSRLSDFLDDSLYLNLRNKLIRILPEHWVHRIVNIITFQAKQYRGSDIAKMCKLNGNQFNSLAEMAVYVCDQGEGYQFC